MNLQEYSKKNIWYKLTKYIDKQFIKGYNNNCRWEINNLWGEQNECFRFFK